MSNKTSNKMFTKMKFRSKKKLQKDASSSSLLLDNILESKKFDERYVGDDQSAYSIDKSNTFSRDNFVFKGSQNSIESNKCSENLSKDYIEKEPKATIRNIPNEIIESSSDSDSCDDDLYLESEDAIDMEGNDKIHNFPRTDEHELPINCDLLNDLDISVDVVDQIMDDAEDIIRTEPQNQNNDEIHAREDSSDLLRQLHTALSMPKNSSDVLNKSRNFEDDIENAASETDRLQQQLKESIAKRKMLQEKLARVKAKEKNLEEVREKVHYLSNRERNLTAISMTAPTLKACEKEMFRKEDSNDDVKVARNSAEIRGDLPNKWNLEDESSPNSKKQTTQVTDIKGKNKVDDQERNHNLQKELETGFQFKSRSRNGSYDEKLRRSMLKVKAMEAMGDMIREDSNYEIEYEDIATFTEVNEKFQTSVLKSDAQETEVMALRSRLQEQQDEIETLEQERDFQKTKIGELTELLKMADENQIEDHLTQKSLLVAELGHEVTSLRQKLAKAEARAVGLESELDANKRVVANLSEDIWSIEGSKGESSDVAQSLMKNGGLIPQTHALEMTIANLQKKIEVLEEEKAHYMCTVEELNESVTKLSNENEARQLKISKLESHFRSMNKREHLNATPEAVDEESAVGAKSNRLKSWANNKMNKAQERIETIKQDIELSQIKNPDQVLPS